MQNISVLQIGTISKSFYVAFVSNSLDHLGRLFWLTKSYYEIFLVSYNRFPVAQVNGHGHFGCPGYPLYHGYRGYPMKYRVTDLWLAVQRDHIHNVHDDTTLCCHMQSRRRLSVLSLRHTVFPRHSNKTFVCISQRHVIHRPTANQQSTTNHHKYLTAMTHDESFQYQKLVLLLVAHSRLICVYVVSLLTSNIGVTLNKADRS